MKWVIGIICEMTFSFENNREVEAAAIAVSHEGNVGRASSEVSKKGNDLIISIKADDVVALRATANAYLRALQVIEEVKK